MLYSMIDPNGNACHSHIPYCGYSYETLRDMEQQGHKLLIDGKKAKFPSKAEWQAAVQNAQAKKP